MKYDSFKEYLQLNYIGIINEALEEWIQENDLTYTTTYTYNSDGVRIKKENILKTHEYTVDGNKIIKQKITASNGVYELFYNYDQYGELLSVELNGNIYFYIKDALGIIQKLVDENGNTVVSYTYDGWGKVTINNSSITDIGTYNPFMYKDYYYDKELGMYNINNRIY